MNKISSSGLLIITALTAMIFFASCGGGDTESPPPSPSPTAAQTPAPNIAPAYGGTLTLSMRYPLTLNPLLNEDETVDKVLSLLFEHLFVLDGDLKPTPNPLLIANYSVAADMKSVTVTLRDDVYWSNGEKITSADLAFSIEYLKTTAPASAIYKSCVSNILSASVSGGDVRINLIQPYGQMGYMLTFPIIPQSYYKGVAATNALQLRPVGNGPYTFESYNPARELALTVNSWSPRGPAYIENVKVLITGSDEDDINAFEHGATDAIATEADAWSHALSITDASYVLYPSDNFDFIGFNFDNWLLTDKNIRTAIAHCIPYSQILETVYKNAAVLAPTPVNPSSWLCDSETSHREFNLKTAAYYIEGWEGLKFTILVNLENDERIRAAEILSANLKQIGVETELAKVPWDEYTQRLNNREFDIFIGGYKMTGKPDYAFMLHTDAAADVYTNKQLTAYGTNILHYKNEHMDLLLKNAFGAGGDEAVMQAYAELQRYIFDDIPLIGLVYRQSALLVNSRVYGPLETSVNNVYKNIHEWFVVTE